MTEEKKKRLPIGNIFFVVIGAILAWQFASSAAKRISAEGWEYFDMPLELILAILDGLLCLYLIHRIRKDMKKSQ